MPRLPQASDLNNVSPQAARSFVNMPTPNISGAFGALADGVGQIGGTLAVIDKDRQEKARKQERFDTKMALIGAEEAYAKSVADLDPLDPEYVEKKKAARRETFRPVLENVKDPENKMFFEEDTFVDYTNIGIKADAERRNALGTKAELDVNTYVDGVRNKVRAGGFKGDPLADVFQAIDDNQYLTEIQKQKLKQDHAKSINADVFEADFEGLVTGGVSVTPSVRTAVAKAAAGGPSWMEAYLLRAATLESSGGRKKVNPVNPNVGGTWQFDTATAGDVGLSADDRFDDEKSAAAAAKLTMRNFKLLQEALGRDPTPAELYLAHQQGIGAAPKLLANPDAKASDVVGLAAVKQNLPDSLKGRAGDITAGQFAQLWMGKFDGGSGAINQDEVLETLRLSEGYQNMGPDERAAAEKDVITRIDKQNKEVAKTAKISLQRDTVDYAVAAFEDRSEAERFVKEALAGDPEAREEALKMLTTQYNRIDEAEKVKYDALVEDTWANVNAAIDAGDIAAAQQAIPADGLKQEDLAKLKKRIADGDAKADDPKVLDGITALKIGNEQERRYFANVDGQGLNLSHLRNVLSRDTLEALAKEQDTYRKQYETKAGKLPTYASAGEMLDLKLRALGVDISAKASPEDLRFKETMRAMLARNTEAAVSRVGRDLTPSEMEDVLDQTFLEFREKGRPGFQIRAFGTPLFEIGEQDARTITVRDVVDEYGQIEENHGVIPGAYLDRAQRAIAAKGLDVTPARLRAWLKAGIDNGVLKKTGEAQ